MVDDNATKKIFESVGFTENEFDVYSAFLKFGDSSAAELARRINMDKSSAYRASENLELKGLLIKHLDKGNTIFQAASPDVLLELYNARKSQLDMLVDEFKKQANSPNRSSYITIEKGLFALQFRMTESLESKEKVIMERFSDKFRLFDDKDHVKFIINYARERAKRHIKMLALEENYWQADTRFEDVMVDANKYYKEIRRMPKDAKMEENSLRIWDNTINIVSEDENKEFIVITIKDKFVVKLMKDIFNFIWDRSDPI